MRALSRANRPWTPWTHARWITDRDYPLAGTPGWRDYGTALPFARYPTRRI